MRNLGRLVPAICRDLSDWLVPTRVKSSQLLSVLLLHSEDHSTQHLQPLLAVLYRACSEAERDVVANVSSRELMSSDDAGLSLCWFDQGSGLCSAQPEHRRSRRVMIFDLKELDLFTIIQ